MNFLYRAFFCGWYGVIFYARWLIIYDYGIASFAATLNTRSIIRVTLTIKIGIPWNKGTLQTDLNNECWYAAKYSQYSDDRNQSFPEYIVAYCCVSRGEMSVDLLYRLLKHLLGAQSDKRGFPLRRSYVQNRLRDVCITIRLYTYRILEYIII